MCRDIFDTSVVVGGQSCRRRQLVITAVVLEGCSKSEVARNYGLSRYWVHQPLSRYHADGAAAGRGGD
jgi:transposase